MKINPAVDDSGCNYFPDICETSQSVFLQKRSPHVSYSNRIVELLIILNVCDIDENDRLLN